MVLLTLAIGHCTQLGLITDDDDTNTEALLAALFNNQCNLGGVVFTNAGAACGLNTVSGSGILTAVGARSDFLSVQLNFQLADASSSIQLVGGGSSGIVADSTTSNYFKLGSSATSIHSNGSTMVSGAGVNAQTWCFEMHFEENPDHLIVDTSNCVSKSTSSATGDEETNTLNTSGGVWGLVLSNASITGLTLNGSEIFSD